MRTVVLAIGLLLPVSVSAVELSISRVSSVPAVPSGTVTRTAMPPPDGVTEAPQRLPPAYDVTDYRNSGSPAVRNIPRPPFNPVKVSYCASETF